LSLSGSSGGKGKDLLLDQQRQQHEVELNQTARYYLLVAPLPYLLAHTLENTAITASLLLQGQHLVLVDLLPRELFPYRVLVPGLVLPSQQLDLIPQFGNWLRKCRQQRLSITRIHKRAVVGKTRRNGSQHLVVLAQIDLADQMFP
jgi:hypothetical protein